jgi:hypothetical protein
VEGGGSGSSTAEGDAVGALVPGDMGWGKLVGEAVEADAVGLASWGCGYQGAVEVACGEWPMAGAMWIGWVPQG